ncbi:MAG: NikM domain containing protein [Pseudozobellia sp.]|nr:NikM domain containing protein [Pseudozobellia sp.]MBG47865.1 NikM domain containing protein [Pseudozobellia sp.]|tara:strand:- start:954706 stop:955869 length:1164 start_codon:yes stop_codon:yes gene_type:complete
MKRKIFALLGLAVLFCSHDMYLKLDTYFLEPNTQSIIHLFNGTFDKSENVIDRDRMIDASLSGDGERYQVAENQWSEKDSVTILNFKSGEVGTWVAGVSTKARSIEMDAEAFNRYLRHDGVLDMLKWREENNALDKNAVEKYSKHVKAIFQVGDKTSDDWKTTLGYPIEFIPQSNPYEKYTGEQLEVKLLFGGKPLANQLVYANYKVTENHHSHPEAGHGHSHEKDGHSHEGEAHSHDDGEEHTHKEEVHSHDGGETHSHEKEEAGKTHSHDGGEPHSHEEEEHTDDHVHTEGQQLRTDANGIITVDLAADGIYYLRTIHLAHSDEEGLTHESNWATLTFEVVHGHSQEEAHAHSHAEEDEFPSYIFWIGSLLIIGGLFWWFNRKKE